MDARVDDAEIKILPLPDDQNDGLLKDPVKFEKPLRPPLPQSVELGWLIVNGENKRLVPLTWEEKIELVERTREWPPNVCCFSGSIDPRWDLPPDFAPIVPDGENFIPGQGLWLRVNGLLDSDFQLAEAKKMAVENLIPLQKRLARHMNLHYRGVVFLPTMGEACRLVHFGEKRLSEWASRPQDDASFKLWRSSDLAAHWDRTVDNIALNGADGTLQAVKIKVYECTMLVVHTDDKDSSVAKCSDEIHLQCKLQGMPRQYIDGILVREQEDWVWKERRNKQGEKLRVLPRTVRRMQTEDWNHYDTVSSGEREGVDIKCWSKNLPEDEPELLLPFEPVAAVFVFWKMMEELRKEGWEITEYLDNLMKVLQWYLVLAESDSPTYMWKKIAQRPTVLLGEPPVCPSQPNETARVSHFQFNGLGHSNGKVPSDFQAPSDLTQNKRDPRFDSWCGRRHEDIGLQDWGGSGSSSEYVDLECEHEECYTALDAVEQSTIAALAVEADSFKDWMSEDGLAEALSRLRCKPPQVEVFDSLKKRYDQIERAVSFCQNDCGFKAREKGLFKDDLPYPSIKARDCNHQKSLI